MDHVVVPVRLVRLEGRGVRAAPRKLCNLRLLRTQEGEVLLPAAYTDVRDRGVPVVVLVLLLGPGVRLIRAAYGRASRKKVRALAGELECTEAGK